MEKVSQILFSIVRNKHFSMTFNQLQRLTSATRFDPQNNVVPETWTMLFWDSTFSPETH